VMTRFFTARELEAVAASIHRRTAGVVEAALTRGDVDFSAEVAERLPIEAICDLMGVPDTDRPHLLAHTKSALSADDRDADPADALVARSEILYYLSDLIAERRRRPGTDIVSALTTAEVDGELLGDDDLALNCYSLIIGGDESTRLSATTAAVEFARHPQQWQRLQRAATVDSAVEEVLRWSTPSMHFARTAAVDTEIGGTPVRAGEIVTLWNTSANFDGSRFPEPERFDIKRTPNEHVTFGLGRHYCLGALMARMELRSLLTILRERVAAIELTAAPRQVYSTFLFGYSSALLRLVPSSCTSSRLPIPATISA